MPIRIFHCYTHPSSFILKDSKIFSVLGKSHNYYFKVAAKWMLPFTFFIQFIQIILFGWRIKLFVIQFAGYHSFLPCLFARFTGKKSLIIAGGTDCVSYPGIGYGNFYRPILRNFTAWSYRLCSAIAPKHETLWYCRYDFDDREPREQGISAFVKGIVDKHKVIHNGYDVTKWHPDPKVVRRPKSFITISGAFEYPFQVSLKGIDLILEVAPFFPDCEFTIAGVPDWKKLDVHSDNIKVLPPIPHHELPEIFSNHTYYMQLSMAEGFPNALCEAMLCGCTPIVSEVFSMPEIVGESGYILEKRDVSLLRKLLERVLLEGPPSTEKNHGLIATRYPAERREKELLELIRSMGCL